MMGIRNALSLFRATADAVPPGAVRPSMTMWWDPGGVRPPVSWVPGTGDFATHWDWDLFTAMAVPGYWRARMLITQSIGGMPLGSWKDLAQDPIPSVLAEPNPGEDRCTTVAAWVGDLLDHGNAVGLVTGTDSEGRVSSIQPWPATDVAVATNENTGRDVYTFARNGQPVRIVDASRVFHAKGVLPYPGAPRGMGILEVGLSTLGRVQAQDTYAANAYRTGVPAGLLKVKDPDLQAGSPDDPAGYATAHGIKAAWRENIATGDIAVLSELVDFTPLAWTPTDAQAVEARQLSLVDVANLFGLDPYWVGSAQTSAPYQNVQDSAVQLARFTLDWPITALEAQFSRCLLRGHEARFNRDRLLREQRAERVATEIAMLNAGIVTVDEIRGWEGLPPLPATPDTNPATVTALFPATGDTATNQPATGTGG